MTDTDVVKLSFQIKFLPEKKDDHFAGPTSVDPPLITDVRSRSAVVTWEAPMQPNGVILSYSLYINDQLHRSVSQMDF